METVISILRCLLPFKIRVEKKSFSSPYCSVESLTSSNSSGKRRASRRERNYNVNIFRGLKNSGEKPTANDVKDTRRECQMYYNERVSLDERRQTVADALATIDQLASFLRPAESDEDVLFLTEYQAFICWAFTQIRFGNFSTNMAKQFLDVKICLEYAEVVDEEAVRWCRKAMENAQESRRRASSRLSDSVRRTNSVEDVIQWRNSKRIDEVMDFLSANLTQIELVWTLKIHIGTTSDATPEKLIEAEKNAPILKPRIP